MSEFLAMAPEPPQQPRRNGQPNPVPGYLVLFPRHHSAWMAVETMTGAVRTAAKHVDGSSAEILPVRRVGEAPIHVYERLGVAAMDLSPEERGVLESEGATVVENVVSPWP